MNSRQLNTLRTLCQTLIPSLALPSEQLQEYARILNVDAESLQALIEHSSNFAKPEEHLARRIQSAPANEQAAFSRVLRLLELPLLGFPVTGRFIRFGKLNLEQRVQVLQSWNGHRNPELRKLFQTLKRLTMFLTYGKDRGGQDSKLANPSWSAMGYRGQNPLSADPTRELEDQADKLSIHSTPAQNKLDCDVLVIGSGAGGSVAANILAEAGFDCVIAEKGDWVPRKELGQGEYWGNRSLFEKHGSLSSEDLAIVILAGSTVGGGTAVNWMTSLEPDQHVRCQWADDFGWKAAINGEFQQSLDLVQATLGVNTEQSVDNPQNDVLRKGCERLGWSCRTLPRNALSCGDCGYCGYGCRNPGKQDVRQNFLSSAIKKGARLVPGLEIRSLKIASGSIVGATALTRDSNLEKPREIEIRCRAAVCAGGALQTPILLLKSGVAHPMLGRNLHLHPTTAMASFHNKEILPWSGQPQTAVCDQFSNLDGKGYGVRFETAPVHPGFGGLALAWQSPLQHKLLMSQLNRMANSIVLCRDCSSGQIKLDRDGRARIQYQLGQTESDMLLRGVTEVVKIHQAAGAHTIIGPHQELIGWRNDSSPFPEQTMRLFTSIDSFCDAISQAGSRSNHLSLFSAHQLSTCRISEDPKTGPIDMEGRFRGVKNLFVADGSLLPTSSGVNPMISIMGAAHWISLRIREHLS